MDFHIFCTVKGIVANKFEIIDGEICAVHAKIITPGLYMCKFYTLTVPERLCRIGKIHIIKSHIMTAAEIFRRLNQRILDPDMIRIPHPRTRHLQPGTIPRLYIFAVPERIFPLKRTVLQYNIPTLLKRRLPIIKNRLFNMQLLPMKQRPLPCKIRTL